MSSILEALKKLEDEKAARQSGEAPITGKIVKEGRRTKKRPKWLLTAEMTAVAAVAVLATYLIMGDRSVPIKTAQETPVKENFQPAPQTPQPPAPRPQGTPEPRTLQPPPSPPPKASAPHPFPSSQRIAKTPSSRIPVKSSPLEGISGQEPQLEVVAPERPVPLPGEDAKPANPSFKVTGIGWRKGSADRLAIVNGRPVSEGAMIEGAKVEEIFPDRVRFSFNGKSIEVPVGEFPGETP